MTDASQDNRTQYEQDVNELINVGGDVYSALARRWSLSRKDAKQRAYQVMLGAPITEPSEAA